MFYNTWSEHALFIKIFISLVTLLIVIFISASFSDGIGPWKYMHWLFSYEYDFVKRGLPGEFLNYIGFDKSYQNINNLSYFILGVVTFFFVIFLGLPSYLNKSDFGLWLFFVLAIVHPATIQHLYYDVGRFDALLLLITLVVILAVSKMRPRNSLWIVVLGVSAAILIHEAMFFIFLPLLLVFYLYINTRETKLHFILLSLLFTLLTYIVSTFGSADTLAMDEYFLRLKASFPELKSTSSLYVLYQTSLIENIQYTFNKGVSLKRLTENLYLIAYLFPVFILVFRIFILRGFKLSLKGRFLLLSTLSPLLLFPIGHDHFRWWSLVVINVFIVISLLIISEPLFKKSFSDFIVKYQYGMVIYILVGFLVGPIGVTSVFPKW